MGCSARVTKELEQLLLHNLLKSQKMHEAKRYYPLFNAANTIVFNLRHLLASSEPWEVIVSNNGSTDETVAIVEQYQDKLPNLRIVDSSDQRGAAHARNVGALAAAGEALAFCDADDEVPAGVRLWVRHSSMTSHGDKQQRTLDTKVSPLSSMDQEINIPYLPHASAVTSASDAQFMKLSVDSTKLSWDSRHRLLLENPTCRHRTPLRARRSGSSLAPYDQRYLLARLRVQCPLV